VRQVRLIDADGQQRGIVETRDALRLARESDLDLVLVGEQAQPPVAKLLDYGKYRYELQQQEKEARKRSRAQEMKAIKFRIKIDRHDYQTKVNHIKRFLKRGSQGQGHDHVPGTRAHPPRARSGHPQPGRGRRQRHRRRGLVAGDRGHGHEHGPATPWSRPTAPVEAS
jgi:hypothetical protein